MNAAAFVRVAGRLEAGVAALGLRAVGLDERGLPAVLAAAWVRRTWTANRGVALLGIRGTQRPHELAPAVREEIARRLGYVPWVYPMRLHLVLVGEHVTASDDALRPVLAVDDPRCALHSVSVLELGGQRAHVVAAVSPYAERVAAAIAAALDPG